MLFCFCSLSLPSFLQVKPLGMLSQEGESSSASSQQSSTNSSPWLPQYATNEKMPSPLNSQPQATAHRKSDCDAKTAFEEDHEMPSCSTKITDSKKVLKNKFKVLVFYCVLKLLTTDATDAGNLNLLFLSRMKTFQLLMYHGSNFWFLRPSRQ